MSFFQGASGISIGQGTFNAIQGNQTNNIYHQIIQHPGEERTEYDEFPDIRRGLIRRLSDLQYTYSSIHHELKGGEVEFRVERTISTAVIHGDLSSRFTVATYKGQDAVKAWKKDFQQFSDNTDTTKMQLFGINRSSIPLLIFYGELMPLTQLWDRIGLWGRSYTETLVRRIWECSTTEVWVDPGQGKLIRGLGEPIIKFSELPRVGTLTGVKTLSSNAELLQEDVCWRYLSQMPFDRDFDRGMVKVLHFMFAVEEKIPPTTNRLFVLSSLNRSIIAAGSETWVDLQASLDSDAVMLDGRTRFTLKSHPNSNFLLFSNPIVNACAWLSQASSVFHNLGISLDDDLLYYEVIWPSVLLEGSIEKLKQRRRLEGPPIYLFLRPLSLFPPLKPRSAVSIHIWSFDRDGKTPISDDYCEHLGLPTKLSVVGSTRNKHCWPTETYASVHKWQIARGFNPTTTDFGQYLGFPVWESVRFEELSAES